MASSLALLITLSILPIVCVTSHEYSGYKVLRLKITDAEDAQNVMYLSEDLGLFSIWNELRPTLPVDVAIAPENFYDAVEELNSFGIAYEVKIDDLQPLIEAEKTSSSGAPDYLKASPDHSMSWDRYHPVEDFHSYFDYLEKKYDFVSTETIGHSFHSKTHEF